MIDVLFGSNYDVDLFMLLGKNYEGRPYMTSPIFPGFLTPSAGLGARAGWAMLLKLSILIKEGRLRQPLWQLFFKKLPMLPHFYYYA